MRPPPDALLNGGRRPPYRAAMLAPRAAQSTPLNDGVWLYRGRYVRRNHIGVISCLVFVIAGTSAGLTFYIVCGAHLAKSCIRHADLGNGAAVSGAMGARLFGRRVSCDELTCCEARRGLSYGRKKCGDDVCVAYQMPNASAHQCIKADSSTNRQYRRVSRACCAS